MHLRGDTTQSIVLRISDCFAVGFVGEKNNDLKINVRITTKERRRAILPQQTTD